MKKKIIALTLLATTTLGSVAFAASIPSGTHVYHGRLQGSLTEHGYKGAAGSTTLDQMKNGAQQAYVYLETKQGGTLLQKTQGVGTKSPVTSSAYAEGQHNSANNFWNTHRALAGGVSDSRSLTYHV